ncbi:MAG TPA: SDR family oxidoreductase [Candidatus Sulfotelmatobacter sp.]|nr:SDR family oxidoreductase [Candidatus Sulfotelmatobacter sp.]
MNLTGNTIFITGGTSGIGRAYAEAFHKLGNQVIISGRRKGHLAEITKANPGMQAVELDVESPTSITAVCKKLIADHPKLNAVINNAGIMQLDDTSTVMDDAQMTSIIATNLMGPIRVTSAVIEHLKKQPSAYVITVSSGLAFTPMSLTTVYCATKAAIHSYSMTTRYKLKDTSVKVVEIVPPWVQTDLLNSKDNPNAMPLPAFIDESMKLLGTDANEILVQRVLPLRNNVGPNEGAFFAKFNEMIAQAH